MGAFEQHAEFSATIQRTFKSALVLSLLAHGILLYYSRDLTLISPLEREEQELSDDDILILDLDTQDERLRLPSVTAGLPNMPMLSTPIYNEQAELIEEKTEPEEQVLEQQPEEVEPVPLEEEGETLIKSLAEASTTIEKIKKELSAEELKVAALDHLLRDKTQEANPKQKIEPLERMNVSAALASLGNDDVSTIGDTEDDHSLVDFRFYSYFKVIFQTIFREMTQAFRRMSPPGKSLTTVAVIIDRLGNPKNFEILETTALAPFANFLKRIVEQAAPFRPLPRHLNMDEFLFVVTFDIEYTRYGLMVGLPQ